MATEAQKRATNKYNKSNTKMIAIRFNLNNENDIKVLKKLDEVENKTNYIRELILKDIENKSNII